jgi:hypothetical protein
MVDDVRKEQLMTRAQVVAEWDISLATVRRDDLPRVHHRGTGAMYCRSDIEAWARKRGLKPRAGSTSLSGEDFAVMFDLLAAGVTPDQIVQRTRHHPDAVEAVIERRQKMMKAIVVMNEEEVAELLSAAGAETTVPIRDAKHLIQLVRGAREPAAVPAHPARETEDPETVDDEGPPASAHVVAPSPVPAAAPMHVDRDVLAELHQIAGDWSPKKRAVLDRLEPDFGEWAAQQIIDAKAGRCTLDDARALIFERAAQEWRKAAGAVGTGGKPPAGRKE